MNRSYRKHSLKESKILSKKSINLYDIRVQVDTSRRRFSNSRGRSVFLTIRFSIGPRESASASMRLRICLPQHPAGRVNEDGRGRRTACCIVVRARERLLGSASTLSDVAARVSRREVTDLDEPRFRRRCAPVERECASREFRSYRGVFPAECNHLWIYARQLRPQLPEPAARQDQDGQVARNRVALDFRESIDRFIESRKPGAEIPSLRVPFCFPFLSLCC